MSALDLDALERRARKGLVLNPDETLALITRLRAAEGALRAIASGIVEANRKLKEMWPDYDDSDVPALAVARAMLITLNAERDATMRAAEARTAWQPIETAPHGEWVLVYGTRFRAALPSVEPARLDEYGWADKGGYSVRPIAWAPLPAAPEAP